MGNAESSSLGVTVIKVAAVAAAAAAAAWSYSSFSKDTGSRYTPPRYTPPPEGYEELQMLNVPEDYMIRRRDPTSVYHQSMMLEIDDGGDDDDDDGHQQQIPVDPIQGTIKIMSYNIFNLKYIKLHERMKAIGKLIQRHSPDIILFQEITPNIYEFFQSCKWWGIYECSVQPEKATRQFFCMLLSKLPVKRFFYKHFENTNSSKGLSGAKITTGSNKSLTIATCHFKRPGNKYIAERASQAKEALDHLKHLPNVVLGGDMNWDDNVDGPFPLIGRWCDAWSILRSDENGYTYDTESNGMMNHSRSLQKRFDRFICRLKHFKMIGIEIIGTEAIPGVSYKSKGKKLPVLPSDHYGLILTISPK